MFRIRNLYALLLITVISLTVVAQERPTFTTVDDFMVALDDAISGGTLDEFWDTLVDQQQVPLIIGETVVFLYRGQVQSVAWRGDFNNWDNTNQLVGQRQGNTDLWLATAAFPTDARLDYKIVLNESDWILDPANPKTQLGGFGPNSEIAMPDYIYSDWVIPRANIEQGILKPETTFASVSLGYAVNYRVYVPVGYSDLSDLPVIYVLDGQEYADDAMGSMVIVLDNLIADAKIQPILAVFIDPRDPKTLANKRESQFRENPQYAAFVATELVPLVDQLYKTNRSPSARAILGTSFGGLGATYILLSYPDVFQLAGIQSPAYWASGETTDLFDALFVSGKTPDFRIFMNSGNPQWDSDIALAVSLLDQLGIDYQAIAVNEGHSWGQWRALLDDLLIFLFGV